MGTWHRQMIDLFLWRRLLSSLQQCCGLCLGDWGSRGLLGYGYGLRAGSSEK